MSYQCSTCKFFLSDESNKNADSIGVTKDGECRRNPPPFLSSTSPFPHVLMDDWCGEYIEKQFVDFLNMSNRERKLCCDALVASIGYYDNHGCHNEADERRKLMERLKSISTKD